MLAAEGILTARGGLVSHAAVVARGWGKPAVVGAEALRIVGTRRSRWATPWSTRATGSRSTAPTGRWCWARSRCPRASTPPEFDTILGWADEIRAGHLGVRANADNGPDAANARSLRGRGDRAVPDRAHVPGRGPAAHRAPDDPGRHPGRGGGGPRGAPGGPAGRLRRDPRGHGRPAGDHPAARPAAARVPARHRGAGHQGGHRRADRRGGAPVRGGQGVARVQPHARHPRRAPRGDQARALRHAGAGPDGGGPGPGGGRRPPDRRDHDPPHRLPGGAGAGPLVGGGGHRRGPRPRPAGRPAAKRAGRPPGRSRCSSAP